MLQSIAAHHKCHYESRFYATFTQCFSRTRAVIDHAALFSSRLVWFGDLFRPGASSHRFNHTALAPHLSARCTSETLGAAQIGARENHIGAMSQLPEGEAKVCVAELVSWSIHGVMPMSNPRD